MRQPVRIQATSAAPIVAVAVSQAPTVLTLPSQQNDSVCMILFLIVRELFVGSNIFTYQSKRGVLRQSG